MKNVLFASAAAAALFVAAPALAQSVGSAGLGYSHAEADIGGFDVDSDIWTADASVAIPAGQNWTVTLDGGVTYDDDATSDEFGVNGTAHLTRNLGDARVGGFVGLAEVADETAWAVGFEGAKYLANTTLVGQVAYGEVDDSSVELWSIGGQVRYFVSDNFRIDGGLNFANVDLGPVDDDMWSIGVGGEYQFAGTPWSITAGYDRAELDTADVTVDTFSIGLRYSFGGDLRARDRSGADLGGIDGLFSAF